MHFARAIAPYVKPTICGANGAGLMMIPSSTFAPIIALLSPATTLDLDLSRSPLDARWLVARALSSADLQPPSTPLPPSRAYNDASSGETGKDARLRWRAGTPTCTLQPQPRPSLPTADGPRARRLGPHPPSPPAAKRRDVARVGC
ncbi:hypothetical protein EV121DRAFT_297938 [Schizophyllum commune]